MDTQHDTDQLQLVNEANEARLGFYPGTVATHPAYGLYCLRVVVCVPWDAWQPTAYHQFYVRFAFNAPYICWWENWWYYWRTPLYAYQVQLNGAQEVPANASPGTAQGVIFLDPIYSTLCYDIRYQNLSSGFTAAHIHGPAGPGTNAGVLFPLSGGVTGSTTGRLFGVTTALTSTQLGYLQNGLLYANIHSTAFPNGEIRSQVFHVSSAVYCPWRPSWIPLLRWGRGGPLWGLTVTHPYCYGWDPWYKPRPFCLYGLRYYFAPIGQYLVPGGAVPTGLRPPGIAQLNFTLNYPWLYYPYIPFYNYWSYSPYCARWYWWQCTPFYQYRWCPPVVQFATWVNPDPTDPPVVNPFPNNPDPTLAGTVAISSLRAHFIAPGDVNGDGFVNLSDQGPFREQQNTSNQDTTDTDVTPP